MKGFLAVLICLATLIGFCYLVETSDWNKRQREEAAAQRRADAKPRLVSEGADGCKVYAFKPADRWLYFSRCPQSQTSTTNEWSVTTGAGKTARTHTETMRIEASQ
jgi:hypothetical protein